MTDRDAFRPEALLPRGAALVRDDSESAEGRVRWTLAGRVVATGWVDADGAVATLNTAVDGDGWRVELHLGAPVFAEPVVDGLVHGTTVQWATDGRIVSRCAFVRGTGLDLWMDELGRLSESHPYVEGRSHGIEQWWDGRWPRVHDERHWYRGQLHGIERRWDVRNDRKLDPGYPKFWVDGEEVDRATYDDAGRTRDDLAPWRAEDDTPERPWPAGYTPPSS